MNRVTLDHISSKSGNGFCIADDYENATEFIDGTPEDDLELLAFVVKHGSDPAQDLIQFCNENEKGIEINDTFYPYDKIRAILDAE